MRKIYTAEELAEITGISPLADFIEAKLTGPLAMTRDLCGAEESLEDFITHKPGQSRAVMRFDSANRLSLRSLYQGIGHEIIFTPIYCLERYGFVEKFSPCLYRYIIEDNSPSLWGVGEFNFDAREASYFKVNPLGDALEGFNTLNRQVLDFNQAAIYRISLPPRKAVTLSMEEKLKAHIQSLPDCSETLLLNLGQQIQRVKNLYAHEFALTEGALIRFEPENAREMLLSVAKSSSGDGWWHTHETTMKNGGISSHLQPS